MKPVPGRHDERRSFERLSSFAVAVWGQWFNGIFLFGSGVGALRVFHGGARERGAGFRSVFLFIFRDSMAVLCRFHEVWAQGFVAASSR